MTHNSFINRMYKITIPRNAYKFIEIRTALFWVITQRVVVISYRRFGTIYQVICFAGESWNHAEYIKISLYTPWQSVYKLISNYLFAFVGIFISHSSFVLGGSMTGQNTRTAYDKHLWSIHSSQNPNITNKQIL